MAKGNVAANHRPALAGATLPGYVIERNTRAVAAGLRIEKQSAAKFKLSTVYRGLPEAFVKSGFVKDEKGFFSDVRRPTKHLQNIWRFMGHPKPDHGRPAHGPIPHRRPRTPADDHTRV